MRYLYPIVLLCLPGSIIALACGSSDPDASESGQSGNEAGAQNGTGSGSTAAAGDTGSGDPGGEDGTTLPPGGLHHSIIETLPGDEPTACEHEWVVRMLTYHPDATVPRRMYFDSCNTETNTPSMFVSLSVGEDAEHPTEDPSSGAIIKTTLDPTTGELVPDGISRQFPECVWMHGIAVSDDCGTVAALCRRHWGDDDYDMDSLATHNATDWMTQEECAPHEMWLYEWEGGDITAEPEKYVVHRAVGTQWDNGNNSLILGDDDTYGIAIKARVADDGGQCHEADAFMVMDRSDHTFTNRGWAWACGAGHTRFNKPAYNPATDKYALLCGTDYNEAGTARLGSLYFRPEDGDRNEFLNISVKALRTKGGVGFPQPLADGGFVGLIVGVDGQVDPVGADEDVPLTPPTSIGLVRFDADGALVGDINWVVQDSDHYLSYPQLAPLGDDRYLMGWGTMYDLTNQEAMTDNFYRVPMEYWVQEIDVDGNVVTEPTLVEGAGWGEQDRMVPLGAGAVGWAYIPDPALEVGGDVPSCNSASLQLSVYTSAVTSSE